jgi:hypothetical protein
MHDVREGDDGMLIRNFKQTVKHNSMELILLKPAELRNFALTAAWITFVE